MKHFVKLDRLNRMYIPFQHGLLRLVPLKACLNRRQWVSVISLDTEGYVLILGASKEIGHSKGTGTAFGFNLEALSVSKWEPSEWLGGENGEVTSHKSGPPGVHYVMDDRYSHGWPWWQKKTRCIRCISRWKIEGSRWYQPMENILNFVVAAKAHGLSWTLSS